MTYKYISYETGSQLCPSNSRTKSSALPGILISACVTFSAETRVCVYSRTAVTLSLSDSSVPILGQNYFHLIFYLDGRSVVNAHALAVPFSLNVFVIDCVLVCMGFSTVD